MKKHFAYLLAPLVAACGGSDGGTDKTCLTTSGAICSVAGTGASAAGPDGKLALKTPLYTPQDTAVGPDGLLWISDFNNYEIRSIGADGTVTTQVGLGLLGDSPRDQGETECAASSAKLNHTPNFFFDGNDLYLAAWHDSDVKRVDLTSMMLSDFAGESKRTYYTGDEGAAIMATLDLPSSVAKGPDGNIYIMDQANQVIRRVDASGNIHRFAGVCVADNAGYGGDSCAGTDVPTHADTALHQCPMIALKIGDTTSMVANDKMTHCVEDSTGNPSSWACAWPCTPGESGDGGQALDLRMSQPFGQSADPAGRIAFDKAGNLFFVDSGANRIRKIDTTGVVSTVAGSSDTEGYAGDGGPATAAQLAHPVDIAIADDDTIYFSDVDNNCVRKIDPSGIISTFAGDCSTAGMCGDAIGNCNSDNGADCVTDYAGCFAGDGGPATAARLNKPYGIDLEGNKLYISDSYNNRIRVVNIK